MKRFFRFGDSGGWIQQGTFKDAKPTVMSALMDAGVKRVLYIYDEDQNLIRALDLEPQLLEALSKEVDLKVLRGLIRQIVAIAEEEPNEDQN